MGKHGNDLRKTGVLKLLKRGIQSCIYIKSEPLNYHENKRVTRPYDKVATFLIN